jgi:hypothetical protein
MGTLLAYLKDFKLSITQWLLLSMAAVIAGLVGLLRLQGSRFHNTQVQLLHQQFRQAMDQQDQRVDAAKDRFEKALQEYQAHE